MNIILKSLNVTCNIPLAWKEIHDKSPFFVNEKEMPCILSYHTSNGEVALCYNLKDSDESILNEYAKEIRASEKSEPEVKVLLTSRINLEGKSTLFVAIKNKDIYTMQIVVSVKGHILNFMTNFDFKKGSLKENIAENVNLNELVEVIKSLK